MISVQSPRSGRFGLLVFSSPYMTLKRILERVAELRRCLVDKPVVNWFVQKCTYRNLHARLSLISEGIVISYRKTCWSLDSAASEFLFIA